jgi:glutamine phosphoribosylpyrophosphate amidotransferase
MLEAIGLETDSACVACWNGNYPTPVAGGEPSIVNN